MGRLVLLTLVAALASTATAAASLRPIRRDAGETTIPRLRAGTITIPAGHRSGRIRVIVRLSMEPLAAWHADRVTSSARAARRLDVRSASSRAYLARLNAAQRVAIAQLHRSVPQALVQERYRVVLNGFAVSVPAKKLPALARQSFATKLYPNGTYAATMDRGPSVIGADTFQRTTGDIGDGVKIAVIDTGVDASSPFLRPDGLSYPNGFPKGDSSYTSPKVIVARSFPGPLRDKNSTKPFDPTEPHGTHVSGIAAGDAGTNAPAGPDHPATAALAGVAPRAWIGNYRVFTVPTPLGHLGNTPEIAAAFEQAVEDGMDVINFSGGGAETDPVNDALIEVVHNVSQAGVVPVIAAGNDRDDYGLGSTGSPGTAPDSIAVAAVSNRHVFAPALTVIGGPAALQQIPVQSAGGAKLPGGWGTLDQSVVDVTTVVGADGKPVEAHLCGPASSPNAGGLLPAHSLDGAIVLVNRGTCSFVSKAERAKRAGAVGMILIDNRFGEANPVPVQLQIPTGVIADLDGQRLRAYLSGTGGRARIRVTSDIREILTDRSGVITSFSSAGPTDFGHLLKPDVAAPGLEVLSSTPPLTTGSLFSVFSGTSMATPHVAGAAALLVQHHPAWTPAQVKSALMSTAAAAWGNTARTQEAPVWLEGAGLASVSAADDPLIFTDPQSLSFRDIDVANGAQRRALLLTVSDAGDGAGTWTLELRPQKQTSGVSIDVPGTIAVATGGEATFGVVVHATADAGTGDNYGFIVLRNGAVERRVPYAFIVERPALRNMPATRLQKLQVGDTSKGTSLVSQYCCPAQAFGPPPDYTGKTMNMDGAEKLFVAEIDQPVANFGVSVLASAGTAVIDPWVLGSKDENDVQGYAGTPVDINDLTIDSHIDVGAAGVQFPRLQRFYVAVDSRADPFTGRSHKGTYILNAWANDVTPPAVRLLTQKVAAGRPLLVAQAVDLGAGVDPLSLVIAYKRVLLGASAYDPFTGIVVFGIPRAAPKLAKGKTRGVIQVADFQEAKNINTPGADIYPNTAFKPVTLRVVNGPAVNWVLPEARQCVAKKRERLAVVASSTRRLTRVVFSADGKHIASVAKGGGGIYTFDWRTAGVKKGTHRLTATAFDASGRSDTAGRRVRVCR